MHPCVIFTQVPGLSQYLCYTVAHLWTYPVVYSNLITVSWLVSDGSHTSRTFVTLTVQHGASTHKVTAVALCSGDVSENTLCHQVVTDVSMDHHNLQGHRQNTDSCSEKNLLSWQPFFFCFLQLFVSTSTIICYLIIHLLICWISTLYFHSDILPIYFYNHFLFPPTLYSFP
jgi:hypothetical protein